MNETEKTSDETTPVLIVGGSLVGLSAALFLSQYGIPCLLVERHPGISPFVRAGGFNPRTMEMYRACGLEETIRQSEPENWKNAMILSVESLAGKELTRYLQNTSEYTTPFSPVQMSFITQDRLEPILQARAEELEADLRFHTELISFEQDQEGVSAIIRDLESGEKRNVRARYLVAADGNRSPIRQDLGIGVQGPGVLSHQIFLKFTGDVREALRGRRMIFCYVLNPMVQRGALSADPDGLGGALGVAYDPAKGEREEDFLGKRGVDLVRAAVGIPDLPVEIIGSTTWDMAAFVAERFQVGRIFLTGDSAHVMPPTGGFGANTGIADASNLTWKLAHVIKGQASPRLLESYQVERQPVAQFTVNQALTIMSERMGPQADKPQAGREQSQAVDHETIVFGYRYHSLAVLSEAEEGELQLIGKPEQPTGQPGSRAAHLVLERGTEKISTIDLFGQHFVLLVGSDGNAWCEAAALAAAKLGISLKNYRIGEQGDLVDANGRFLTTYGITPRGAVLVRPDGFIGWRTSDSQSSGQSPELVLEQALSRLLGW